jgi:putative tricarboxylic transport membrane protein
MFETIALSLHHLATFENLLLMNVSLFFGIIVGAIPGLTGMLAITLFLPLTFGLSPVSGLLVLLGLYVGGVYGGSITAILINTPGSPAATATVLDGYSATLNGKARKALDMALYASCIGGVASAILLLFLSPQIAKLALKFGPSEYFAISFFGISIISSVSGDNLFKGIISGSLGILISCVGVDVAGTSRFTFGNYNLLGGIPLVVTLIGLFALAEILINKNRKLDIETIDSSKIKHEEKLLMSELAESKHVILRGTLIGNLIGAIPGTGGAIASYISYSEAKRFSKQKEQYGKGCLEGVAATESANNAATGTALIPLLTLGIPGDAAAAIMMGALTVHGMTPGPKLFSEQGPQIYAIIIGFTFINIFMLFQGKILIKLFTKLSTISYAILAPVIAALCLAGAFAVNNTIFSLYEILAIGILALVMHSLEIPRSPMLLGLVLGPLIENNYRRTMAISENSLSIFLQKPISFVFLLLAAISFLTPLIRQAIQYYRKRHDSE